jgi:hypothetical protein
MTNAGWVIMGFIGGVGTSVATYLCFLAWISGPKGARRR